MDNMKEGWITVNGVPTHVCTWGGWITEKLLKSEDSVSNNSIILLLSGNPGVIKYYYSFLQTIYKQLSIPVWILNHAGHEQPSKDDSASPLLDNFDLYNVSSQVVHKAEFIENFIPPDKNIYIISHSFGAKITVELLKKEKFRNCIKKCYLLFPTLERIADTPNGKFIQMIIKHFLTTTVFFSWIFSTLPNFLKYWLIKMYFIVVGKYKVDPNCIYATIDLIHPVILKNVFNLASDEMEKIRELDKEVIEECIDKLRVYFGSSDGWAPLSYHYNLIDVVPKVDSTILDSKYEHCYVLETAEDLALFLTKQIKSDIDCNKN